MSDQRKAEDMEAPEEDGLWPVAKALQSIWDSMEVIPATIVISQSTWLHLMRPLMTKRRWRRLRGKWKAEARAWRLLP